MMMRQPTPLIRRRRRIATGSKNHTKRRTVIRFLVLFACTWLAVFAGALIWYLKKGKLKSNVPTLQQQQNQQHPQSQKMVPLSVQSIMEKRRAGIAKGNLGVAPPIDAEEVPDNGLIHISHLQPLSQNPSAYRSPLLIFTCRRANYLSDTLKDILENIPSPCGFGCPVIISEDGNHPTIAAIVHDYSEKFADKGVPVVHMNHQQYESAEEKMLLKQAHLRRRAPADAYKALAHHYGWALTKVFDGLLDSEGSSNSLPPPERVMILEEDIHTSPDFFSYFEATAKLLDQDETLLAVSAYNDNGHMVKDPLRLHRSDFFPGLGWMMTRTLWKNELESKWPDSYWDDWLRERDQRKNRQVIRPEVSRTFHFGSKGGTSGNQFGSILNKVKLNHENIDWSRQDLSYLNATTYPKIYGTKLRAATPVSSVDQALLMVKTQDVRLEYINITIFTGLARKLGIMDDEKAMVPRTAYKGVVEVRPFGDYFLFLTPPSATLYQDFPEI